MKYDLEERTAKFGEEVLDLAKKLKKDIVNLSLIKQLVRSATSVGANYCEANQASSKRDFLSKIGICRKEANETKYWLRMLSKTNKKWKERCINLWKESHELVLIFSKITANTMLKLKTKRSKLVGGQVALIVLLISAVVMMVGLSMSEKAVTETKIDTDEELLKQAFNVAESGIEYYRGMGSIDYSTGNDRTSVTVTVNDVGEESQIGLDGYVTENKAAFFWLVGHDSDDGSINEADVYGGTDLDICTTIGFAGALKVDFYYKGAGGVYKVKRKGFNLEGSGVVSGFVNDATVTDGCIDVADFLVVGSTPLLLTVTPISGGTELSLKGSENFPFPVQGEEILAVGTVDEEDLGISQQVRVYDVYRIPAFMLEGITAGGSVLSE